MKELRSHLAVPVFSIQMLATALVFYATQGWGLLVSSIVVRRQRVAGQLAFWGHVTWQWFRRLVNGSVESQIAPEFFQCDKRAIVAPTHHKTFDVLPLLSLFWRSGRRFIPLAKEGLLQSKKAPVVAHMLQALGCRGLRRNDTQHDLAVAAHIAQVAMETNLDVLLMPQGTRQDNNEIGEIKTGGFAKVHEHLQHYAVFLIDIYWKNTRPGKTWLDCSSMFGFVLVIRIKYFPKVEGEPREWLKREFAQLRTERVNRQV